MGNTSRRGWPDSTAKILSVPRFPAIVSALLPNYAGGSLVNLIASTQGLSCKAEKVVASLKAEGFPAFIAPLPAARRRAPHFGVRVGPYRTREEAEKVRAKLASTWPS